MPTIVPTRAPELHGTTILSVRHRGNVVLGAGLGGNEKEFTSFGEDFDPHRRALLLDNGLELVRSHWPGPVWIGGNSAPALRRASRWDGWIAVTVAGDGVSLGVSDGLSDGLGVLVPAGSVAVPPSSSPHAESPPARARAARTRPTGRTTFNGNLLRRRRFS